MATLQHTTPKADGYYFPGEFDPHQATWLMYPERTDIYPFGAKRAQRAYLNLVREISLFEKVYLCVSNQFTKTMDPDFYNYAEVIEMESDGNWLRDTGPTFVKNQYGKTRAIQWQFNAWGGIDGGLYAPWDKDALVSVKIVEYLKLEYYKAPMVLEGGAILSDGEGTLLTTEETLLNPNRNPNLSKRDIEIILKEYLNVEKIVWIKNGLYLDEAGGHIDGICSFLSPGVILLAWTDDKNDPQYKLSNAAFEALSSATDAQGRKFIIHKVHQPVPQYITQEESDSIVVLDGTVSRNAGERLPASYLNFYYVNGGVILPIFGDSKHDELAVTQFENLFPDRQIVPFLSRDILLGGGNIHCMTQQQPI